MCFCSALLLFVSSWRREERGGQKLRSSWQKPRKQVYDLHIQFSNHSGLERYGFNLEHDTVCDQF